jgi:hypothetical protein
MIAAWAAAGAGCFSEKVCPTLGCFDNFTATVKRADGSFPTGMHRIEMLADGATLMCAFSFAEESPGIGRAAPTCPSGLMVTVGNDQTCTETRTGNAVSLRCDPIPGQFVERITLPGTPAQVHVWQYVDDAAVLDAAGAPSYAEVFPNGPECGGACRQASESWTLQ